MTIPSRLATLGHPHRLAVFRLLMRRYPDRVPATELARALDLKPNTLSTYVNALMQAGLIVQERAGTSRLYSVNMDATRDTLDYLMQDCCRGRPELCAPADHLRPKDMYNVLFLCTGNSARSVFAQALMRDRAGARFAAYSAGTRPRAALSPVAVEVLEENGHDTDALGPKDVAIFRAEQAPDFDFVFTVCDQAANAECPAFAGSPIHAHWGVPDPAQTTGTGAQTIGAFRQTYAALRRRIDAFAALPFTTLDPYAVQQAVDEIGQLQTGPLT